MSDHEEIPLTEAHRCGCGEHDDGLPELDVRTIPHAVRHGAVIGAFAQVAPGAAMVLVAPHDPQPLLAQLRSLHGEDLEISYLESGPDQWKLRLDKRG